MRKRVAHHWRPGVLLAALNWRYRRPFRAVRSLEWLRAVALAVCLVWTQQAEGRLYSYTQIAEVTPVWSEPDYPSTRPAINGSGLVAFDASSSPGPSVYIGDGNSPAALIASSGGGLDVLSPQRGISINDQGEVVFQTTSEAGRLRIMRYDVGGTFTTIADSNVDQVAGLSSPSVNNIGTTVYLSLPDASADNTVMMRGDGGPTELVTGVPEGFDYLGPPSLRRGGAGFEVAFGLQGIANQRTAIRTLSGGVSGFYSLTGIADSEGSDFVQVSRPSIDALGQVAFLGERDSGVKGIYIGDGGPIVTYVDSTGAYDLFNGIAKSTMGVAFEGYLDSGDRGVYVGTNPVSGKVIRVGEALPGYALKVRSVYLGKEGYNNEGQVAALVEFEDGTFRVIRADPLPFFTTYEDALSNLTLAFLSMGESTAEQTVATPAVASVLSLDYLFMETEGVLDVLVNGEKVASLPAPGEIASDFGNLEVLVDPLALFPFGAPSELNIALRLRGEGMETGLLVDNVRFPGLVNGEFQTGTLEHWQTEATNGGAIGLALAPPGVVPEPSTFALAALGLLGLGLCGRARRKR